MIIHIPDKKFISPQDPVVSGNTLSGWFKLEKLKVDSNGNVIEKSREVVADWFPNIITNQGLNRIGTAGDWLNACQVGTGSNTPLASDIAMQTLRAGTSTVINPGGTNNSSVAPFYGERIATYRFATGTASGILSEVGIAWSTTGSTLFSRALILDGGGSPTTITILSDEVLDVSYTLRIYPPPGDQTGNVTITGVGTLTFTSRPAFMGGGQQWGLNTGGSLGGFATSGQGDVYSGTLGPVTGFPSGTSTGIPAAVHAAYSNNSYQIGGTFTFGLTEGNIVGGIRSITIQTGRQPGGRFGLYQIQFSSNIGKNSTNILTLNAIHTWARRP